MQSLFSWDSNNHSPPSQKITEIISKIDQINTIISENAPKWPLEKINKVDLAILRLAVWELLYRPETPPRVAIDEAIELAKEYGTETSFSFVNGVLGSAVKKPPLEEIVKPHLVPHEPTNQS